MCIVLWILKPYPVLSLLVPLYIRHEAKIINFKVTTVLYCYALYTDVVQSQEVAQAHDCTKIVQCWEQREKKKKKKRRDQLGTTSIL